MRNVSGVPVSVMDILIKHIAARILRSSAGCLSVSSRLFAMSALLIAE